MKNQAPKKSPPNTKAPTNKKTKPAEKEAPGPEPAKPEKLTTTTHGGTGENLHAAPATVKQQKIIETAQRQPSLSAAAIARKCGVDRTYAFRVLTTYGLVKEKVEDFKASRADILAGLQARLLSGISDSEIKKMAVSSRILAACQLYDKERIERGQASEHVSILIQALRERQATVWSGQVAPPPGNSSLPEALSPAESSEIPGGSADP